jgi:uncharacterized protein (TIGR03067 family)
MVHIIVFLCVMPTADLKATSAEDDLKTLQGKWEVTDIELPTGERKPDKEKEKLFAKIDEAKLSGIGPEMTIKLDLSHNPKWIDLGFKKGEKDFDIHCIYELSGDTLKICMPVAKVGVPFENKRPGSFEGGKGKDVVVFTMKRANRGN